MNRTNLINDLSKKNNRLKRSAFYEIDVWQKKQSLTLINNKNIAKRSWAEDLITSFSSVACYDQPIPASRIFLIFIIIIKNYFI